MAGCVHRGVKEDDMRRTLVIVAGLVVLGGGVAYYRLGATARPTLVTADVTRGSVVQSVEATGTVQPVDTVEVGAQVTGTVKTLGATFNSEVKQGQVLATLDPASLQAAVDQAQANLTRLEAELGQSQVSLDDSQVKLDRAERLSTNQLIPQTDLETAQVARKAADASLKSAQAQVVQGRASLAQAQVNLQHTVITSPVDGIVLARNVEIGQTVTSGLQTPTLFVIARDLGTMEVSAAVDESDIGHVAAGQPVTFTTDAYGAQVFTGIVTEVRLQPVVTQNVVTYTTIITVPNPGGRLKPGMTATVKIETGRQDNVLRVPAAALRFRPEAELFAALGQDLPAAMSAGSTGSRRSASGASTASRGDNPARPAAGTPGSHAVLWEAADGTLKPVRVTVAISDGTTVGVTGDAIAEGASVVTGVRSSTTVTAGAGQASSGSPLVPSMPRRGGRGL
jgi:HlyD family secretion protein